MSNLNPEQQIAVNTIDGPLLVLAGAGTGKTTVIIDRIINMLRNDVKAENILAVTFTNKASREMADRLKKAIPGLKPNTIMVSTFHSFCARILRRHIKDLSYSPNFGIADEGDKNDVIKEVMRNRHMEDGDMSVFDFNAWISNSKNLMREPQELLNSKRSNEQRAGVVYQDYQSRLKAMNLIDFDDLLMLTVKLFTRDAELLKRYQQRYLYIMVDEYQDTNFVQAKLLNLLAKEHNNLCVVGDDDQSIYGWRGADVSNILDFPKQYPGTKTVKLEQNYRSTNSILKSANTVIAKNSKRHDKALWSQKEAGEKLAMITCPDGESEARAVSEIINNFHFEKQLDYGDIAILYRSNHLSRAFEISLSQAQIPYKVIGTKEFFDRREIKDTAAYLKIIANPADDLSVLRIINVPPRGIGNSSIEKVLNYSQQNNMSILATLQDSTCLKGLPAKAAASIEAFVTTMNQAIKDFDQPGKLGDKIYRYLDVCGYLMGLKRIYKEHKDAENRLDNILELINSTVIYEERRQSSDLVGFLEYSSLLGETDTVKEAENTAGHVTLMTVHAAKGLEFPLVILIAVEEKIFPHERSLMNQDIDEERRLFYVALTRAKDYLVMTRAKLRIKFNERLASQVSQFVLDIPDELIDLKKPNDLFKPASEDQVQDVFSQLYARLEE